MSDHRARIERRITATPGIHFNALVRALDLAPGQLQHHLKRLLGNEAILDEHLYGRTHYYPPDYGLEERRALALGRRETAREILACLLDSTTEASDGLDGSNDPAAVSERLDIARSTLEWQLDRLIEADLVRKRYDEHNRVQLVLVDRERVARLLSAVEPAPADRMADRFVRLADRVFEDAASGQ